MKKYIFLLFIFISVAFANTINEQILKKLNQIEHNQELLKQEIKLRFETVDKRFEAMDKRFEGMDKRFEQVDKRFEQIDKRFEQIDKRFEQIDKRFEQIDKRFEQVDKRFAMMNENFNKRFETLSNFIMTLTVGIFGLIGFMMWDRRTAIEKAKIECVKEVEQSETFNKKADKEYVDRLIKAVDELLLLKDETAKDIFKKYGLI